MPPSELKPARALAWSETILDSAGRDVESPALAIWLPSGVTTAIGLSQNPDAELDVDAMRRDGVGLVRRQSGGGAVLLYRGVVCWEAWATADFLREDGGDGGIRDSYRALSRPVISALRGIGLDIFQAGICDLSTTVANGEVRKVAGTAQLRRKERVLVHGSLLAAPDLELLSRYLRFPTEQPEYRRGRSHRDFCVSVAEAAGKSPADPEALVVEVAGRIESAAAEAGWTVLTPPAELTETAASLLSRKYDNPDWNWRRIRT